MKVQRSLFSLVSLLLFTLILLASCAKANPESSAQSSGPATSRPATSVQDQDNDRKQETTSKTKERPGAIAFSSKYGFSLSYYDLVLDDIPDGEEFAELTVPNAPDIKDNVVVEIRVPDKLYGDPATYIANYKGSGHEDLVVEHLTLDGYPAVRNEFRWTVMKTPMRTIVLTALKDGYFYDVIVTMREDNAVDETFRERLAYVVDTFHLSSEKIDLEQLAPWKAALDPAYPLDLVPLYKVDELDYVSKPGNSNYFGVSYYTKAQYQEAIDFYKETFAAYDHQDFSYGDLSCSKDGYQIEVEIEENKTLETVRVAIVLKKQG